MTAHSDNELFLRPGNDYGNLYEQLYMYIQENGEHISYTRIMSQSGDIR